MYLTVGHSVFLLFHVFRIVGKVHVALAHEGVVECEGCGEVVVGLSALCYLQVIPQQLLIVGVSAVLYDALCALHRALSTKVELVKFMGEIIKHNGDIEDALNDQQFAKATKLDLSQLRAELTGENNDTDSYDLKN